MRNIVRILSVSKPLHRLLSLLAVLIIMTALMEQFFPLITKLIVDEITQQIQVQTSDSFKLFALIFFAFVANVLSSALTSISNRLGDHFAGKIRKFLTEIFYEKILALTQKYFDSQLSGKIVNQLSRGIQTIQDFMNTATNFILPSVLQAVLTLVILGYYSFYIAFTLFWLFPIYIYLSYLSTKKWGEQEIEKNKYEDLNRGRIQEVISNIKVVKTFISEAREFKQVSDWLTRINHIYAQQSRRFHWIDFFRNFSLHVVLLIINIITFYNTFKGLFSLGEMVLILQLLNQVRRPLFAMSFILTRIQQAESGSKEFFDIMQLESQELFRVKSHKPLLSRPKIRFENVDFQYENDQETIKKLSFTIEPGESIALVGHSGSGKTTVVNLILKFYQPNKGEIYLGKSAYSQSLPQYIRQHISLVFQDNELFSSTIFDNVAYGNHKASEKQVRTALRQANALEFVEKLSKGMYSEIGERGVKLSGGQKQRIQIARAILKNTPILVLDEATSSLDSKSEQLVQEGLENLMQDKMVIIIAHRFSTIQHVDRVFVINHGSLVDADTPKKLSQKEGIYKDLLLYQVQGNKKLLANFDLY